jgi:Domain of unknown function (DUF5615)
VRLLLDEHYSPQIAVELRKRGQDVASANERAELRGLGDRELWSLASAEGRALMTENAADFMPLVREAASGGERHFGFVFTSPRSLPRSLGTIGVYVERLDSFLREHSADDAFADRVHWL